MGYTLVTTRVTSKAFREMNEFSYGIHYLDNKLRQSDV